MKQRASKKISVGVVLVPAILLGVAHLTFHRSEARESTIPPTTPKSPELKVLDQFAGTWTVKATLKRLEWNPEDKNYVGRYEAMWVLNGRFLKQEGRLQNVKNPRTDYFEYLNLWTYDTDKKEYRNWYFDSMGSFNRSDTSGKWNLYTKNLVCTSKLEEGRIVTILYDIVDENTIYWSTVLKDKNGSILQNMQGTSTRLKKKK